MTSSTVARSISSTSSSRSTAPTPPWRHPSFVHGLWLLDTPGVTEVVKMENRGHALTIDHGRRDVAETALAFVRRFT